MPVDNRPDWHEFFYSIAYAAATRSTCNRKQVGAVLVKDNRVLSIGYNGSPPGEAHCIDIGCQLEHGHCTRTVHAEANAIATAARFGVSVDGAQLYCTLEPCPACTNLCLSAGVKTLSWREDYP